VLAFLLIRLGSLKPSVDEVELAARTTCRS
jgi:hypothetical protein